jgi:hypothetical protein
VLTFRLLSRPFPGIRHLSISRCGTLLDRILSGQRLSDIVPIFEQDDVSVRCGLEEEAEAVVVCADRGDVRQRDWSAQDRTRRRVHLYPSSIILDCPQGSIKLAELITRRKGSSPACRLISDVSQLSWKAAPLLPSEHNHLECTSQPASVWRIEARRTSDDDLRHARRPFVRHGLGFELGSDPGTQHPMAPLGQLPPTS